MPQTVLFALGLGLVLGLKHATEADHLVAVTTIVSEQRSIARAAWVGVLWGVGHTLALLGAGIVTILLGYTVPPRVAYGLELVVALMILMLGSRILYLAFRSRRSVHVHAHDHDGRAHVHLHFHDHSDAHSVEAMDRPVRHAAHGGRPGFKPAIVGAVHGLAGSAALTLLVLTEVVRDGSSLLGLTYLLVFGLGSIAGMLGMSVLIGLPFAVTGARIERIHQPIRILAGFGSLVFGVYYAWHLSFPKAL